MEPLKSPDVVRRTGVTYRQLDAWTTAGLILPDGGECNPGSGYRRQWTEDEIRIIGRMVRLVHAGMSVSQAARIARAQGEVEPQPGIFVRVEDPT